MTVFKKTFPYGPHPSLWRRASWRVRPMAPWSSRMGETVVLVTACAQKTAVPGRDFFPLTVNYIEKTYAAGRIPGGFFKREGRPTERETLTSRLIDRPIRPLFPDGFANEVQVVATVISLNPDVDADIPALLGASAALSIAGVPFNGPIGAARVGYREGKYLLNPTRTEQAESQLDLVVAGTGPAVLMVESEAKILSEEAMLGAVVFGHEQMQVAIKAIRELAAEAGKPRWDWKPHAGASRAGAGGGRARRARRCRMPIASPRSSSAPRGSPRSRRRPSQSLSAGEPTSGPPRRSATSCSSSRASIVRERILAGEPRIDGRDTTHGAADHRQGRACCARTHGSALFTRGETQALVTTTLGTTRDAQIIDALEGERREPFMLHYNFPPFSVGETGMMGSPKRREIGHGNLARRGVSAVMPDMSTFPYVIRVVSEILESNGSSSMASVCGTSLSLMDAGVPIKAPVAGVAMGLVLEGSRFQVLTDILGDEDHLGDMDFKVAGTRDGVTALQMDIKVEGITPEIMRVALAQARTGRLHILDEMAKVIREPRAKMSEWAPVDHHAEDRPGEDPRRHRQGRRGDPPDHRGDRHHDRHRERWHGEDRLGARHRRPRGAAAHRADHGRRRGGPGLRRQGRQAHGLRRLRDDPAGPRRAGAYLADFRRARRARVATSSRKAIRSASRCSRWIARAASACRCATSTYA